MSSSFQQYIHTILTKNKIKKKELFNDNGVKLCLSIFGGTGGPMASGAFPTGSLTNSGGLVDQIVDLIIEYDFDCVDVDYEESHYFNTGDCQGENWLIELTRGLRTALGNSYLISHAPQAPYLGASYPGGPMYRCGAYLKVHDEVGDLIDFYNVQFYNQGGTTYDSYSLLFESSNGWSGTTAVHQIITGTNYNGGLSIPADKIVVGKFIRAQDGSVGWISASGLKTIFTTAMAVTGTKAWNTGFMTWQYVGDLEQNFAFSDTIIEAWPSTNPSPVTSPVSSPVSPPVSSPVSPPVSSPVAPPVSSPVAPPVSPPTPPPVSSGGTSYITFTFITAGDWWVTFQLSGIPNGVSISSIKMKHNNIVSWVASSSNWGTATNPIYGFGCGSNPCSAPFDFKVESSDGQSIESYSVITTKAADASGTMDQAFGSGYTEGDDDDDKMPWTTWFAIITSILVVIAIIAVIVYCRKNKQKKEVTFDAKDANAIEIQDGGDKTTKE